MPLIFYIFLFWEVRDILIPRSRFEISYRDNVFECVSEVRPELNELSSDGNVYTVEHDRSGSELSIAINQNGNVCVLRVPAASYRRIRLDRYVPLMDGFYRPELTFPEAVGALVQRFATEAAIGCGEGVVSVDIREPQSFPRCVSAGVYERLRGSELIIVSDTDYGNGSWLGLVFDDETLRGIFAYRDTQYFSFKLRDERIE